jgi:hypothetical protein
MDKEKKESIKERLKEGVSFQELEGFTRKHTNELLLILAIFIAALSSMIGIFSGSGWAIALASLCAIVSIIIPQPIIKMEKKMLGFLGKQEKTVQIVIGVVRLIVALFLPFLIFAEIGLLAGVAMSFFNKKAIEAICKEEIIESEEKEHL